MSTQNHESGSDRIAEAVAGMEVDIVVNVQGDEPFVQQAPLQQLLQVFEGEAGQKVQVASLMQILKEQTFINDPNYVKVAVDKNMNSLFFSRSVIPYPRDSSVATNYYEHIGVYAFRKQALIDFTNWPVTPLEAAEKIECLRYLENGIPLKNGGDPIYGYRNRYASRFGKGCKTITALLKHPVFFLVQVLLLPILCLLHPTYHY